MPIEGSSSEIPVELGQRADGFRDARWQLSLKELRVAMQRGIQSFEGIWRIRVDVGSR
jgi:hypothetical protein